MVPKKRPAANPKQGVRGMKRPTASPGTLARTPRNKQQDSLFFLFVCVCVCALGDPTHHSRIARMNLTMVLFLIHYPSPAFDEGGYGEAGRRVSLLVGFYWMSHGGHLRPTPTPPRASDADVWPDNQLGLEEASLVLGVQTVRFHETLVIKDY